MVLSDQRIFVHGAAATPVHLIQAMCDHGKKADIRGCEVIHIHTEGPGVYNEKEYDSEFNNFYLYLRLHDHLVNKTVQVCSRVRFRL